MAAFQLNLFNALGFGSGKLDAGRIPTQYDSDPGPPNPISAICHFGATKGTRWRYPGQLDDGQGYSYFDPHRILVAHDPSHVRRG